MNELGFEDKKKFMEGEWEHIMKKKLFILVILSFFSFVFAKSSVPNWFQNYKTVYPDKDYIAQRGSGDSEETAKTDALAQIARYFQTQVNANLTTSIVAISQGENLIEETKIKNNVEVLSQVELFTVEYTDSYYNKKEKKWYCVAYINRENAWKLYKSQIDMEKTLFENFYMKAEKETEPFLRFTLFKQTWEKGKDFLETLEYGRLLNDKHEMEYTDVKAKLANVPMFLQDSISKSTINLEIQGDYGNIIENAIINAFFECGFVIGDNGMYTLFVEIEPNVIGNNPLSISPSINVVLKNKSNKSFYNYSYKSQEKIVSYTLENAQKKAYSKVADVVLKEIPENIRETFKY